MMMSQVVHFNKLSAAAVVATRLLLDSQILLFNIVFMSKSQCQVLGICPAGRQCSIKWSETVVFCDISEHLRNRNTVRMMPKVGSFCSAYLVLCFGGWVGNCLQLFMERSRFDLKELHQSRLYLH